MEQEREEESKIGLGLSIGISSSYHHHHHHHDHNHKLHILFPPRRRSSKQEEEGEEHHHQQQQQEEEEIKRKFVDDRDEEEKGGARKKLRLSQEQATLLEDTFREHNTLTTFQKQELAEKLNLRPRQVEVWFQNRRARNKLKQTEVDFQLLKKWCETLNEENRRLKKELQELRLMEQPDRSALYLDLPKEGSRAAMGLCPSCGGRSTTAAGSSKKSNSGDSSIAC